MSIKNIDWSGEDTFLYAYKFSLIDRYFCVFMFFVFALFAMEIETYGGFIDPQNECYISI